MGSSETGRFKTASRRQTAGTILKGGAGVSRGAFSRLLKNRRLPGDATVNCDSGPRGSAHVLARAREGASDGGTKTRHSFERSRGVDSVYVHRLVDDARGDVAASFLSPVGLSGIRERSPEEPTNPRRAETHQNRIHQMSRKTNLPFRSQVPARPDSIPSRAENDVAPANDVRATQPPPRRRCVLRTTI